MHRSCLPSSACCRALAGLLLLLVSLPGVALAQNQDPSPSLQVDDRVEDVLGSGGVLYAAGRFTNAIPFGGGAPIPRTGVVAWDARTGTVLPWAPVIAMSGYDYRVDALAVSPDGLTIYMGGVFDSVNGLPRRNAVAVDLQGQVSEWRARSLNVGRVKAIEVSADGSRLFIAGRYGVQSYPAEPRSQQPDPGFTPVFLDEEGQLTEVWSMALAPDESTLYVGSGGKFKSVNGVPREGLAAVDTTTGATVMSFYPGLRDPLNRLPYADVWDVVWHDGQVYAFGDWWETRVDGVWRGSGQRQLECVRFDPITGNADSTMLPWADGGFQGGVIDPIRNKAYGVGHFDQVGSPDDTLTSASFRKDMCVVDLADGAVRKWRPGTQHSSAKSQLYAVDMAAGKIIVGGEFESTNGVNQRNVAVFDLDRRALFVVGDPNDMTPLDRFVYGRLERTLGFDVTLHDDDIGDGSEALGMDCVVISDSAGWSAVGARYRATSAPVLTWNASMVRQMGLTRGWWNTDAGRESLSTITITDPTHPIAKGYGAGAQVPVYGQDYPVVWSQPVAGAQVVATTPTGRPTLFALQTGDTTWDGTPAAGMRIVFPLRREYGITAPDVAHPLWPLFDKSIGFMIDGCGDAVQRLTSGCATGLQPLLEIDGVPRVGGSCDVDLYYAPPNRLAVLSMDFNQPFPQIVNSMCSAVAWSPQAQAFPVVTSPWGRAVWTFPLGSAPSSIYQTFHLQAVIAAPGGPYSDNALSEGYRVRIQP